MARTWTDTLTLDSPAEAVLEAMLEPELLLEAHRLDPAVADATLREVSRTEARLVQEIESTEYGRGMTGIDRSKRQRTTVTFTWDLAARRRDWVYKGTEGDRVRVSGHDVIEPAGDRARLVSEWRVEVKIPLVGGQIEKAILKEAGATRPRFEQILKRHLAKRG